MKAKKRELQGQNLLRHRAVAVFMNLRYSPPALQNPFGRPLTKSDLATLASNAFGRGPYFGRMIIVWETAWRTMGEIPEGKRGCHTKSHSWFNDEGVQLAVRDFLNGPEAMEGKRVSGHQIAKVVGEHLDSHRIGQSVVEAFDDSHRGISHLTNMRTRRIKARTARRWLGWMGLQHCKLTKKAVYVDGHEREDVVKYRNEKFIPDWLSYRSRCVIFEEDGSWKLPEGCKVLENGEYQCSDGSRPLVLVTHDESTVNANDSRRSGWFVKMEDGTLKLPIEPKNRGKGIMISAFLTPGGILRVPDSISNEQLRVLAEDGSSWPVDSKTGEPLREAVHYLEYGSGTWWTGEKMVEQAIYEAIPIFKLAFPGCDALFAFDNASNHSCFAADALVVSKMNLNPGGANVPIMRDGFAHKDGQMGWVQPMQFGDGEDGQFQSFRGKAKGIRQILIERELWPPPTLGPEGPGVRQLKPRNVLGEVWKLDCPTRDGRQGCPQDPDCEYTGKAVGRCCARTLLANQRDFREQRGKLEEMITARGHKIIFYPKFHCELNFIERFWASVKFYIREHCTYNIQGLRTNIREAVRSVPVETIFRYHKHCERIIDTYADPAQYAFGSKEFRDQTQLRKYKNHRQVRDSTKD